MYKESEEIAEKHLTKILILYTIDIDNSDTLKRAQKESEKRNMTRTQENAQEYSVRRTQIAVLRLTSEIDTYCEITASNSEFILFYRELCSLKVLDAVDLNFLHNAAYAQLVNDVAYLYKACLEISECNFDTYITRKCIDLRIELSCYRDFLSVERSMIVSK